jgi:hypothetical protein
MLTRGEFIFTIGYDGPSAVVDNHGRRKFGKLNTKELVEKGLFRAAFSSATYAQDAAEQRFVAEAYYKAQGRSPADVSDADVAAMGKLFGVFLVDVKRSINI